MPFWQNPGIYYHALHSIKQQVIAFQPCHITGDAATGTHPRPIHAAEMDRNYRRYPRAEVQEEELSHAAWIGLNRLEW